MYLPPVPTNTFYRAVLCNTILYTSHGEHAAVKATDTSVRQSQHRQDKGWRFNLNISEEVIPHLTHGLVQLPTQTVTTY